MITVYLWLSTCIAFIGGLWWSKLGWGNLFIKTTLFFTGLFGAVCTMNWMGWIHVK